MSYFNVKADAPRLAEMLRWSAGARAVPVIVEAEKVTIGFGGT